ncbi:potassium-transporting ATPase subunit KdpA [Arthrobacter sp. LAPM80]|uniref:potassium-transporting ATPase subunit KdpA n=1 Tax=Arthrobacter sp. LAPM80 TaxID=3141788 RepID=UPI00398B6746
MSAAMELNVVSLVTQLVALAVLHQPVGAYLATTFTGSRHLALERRLYKLSGTDPMAELRARSHPRPCVQIFLSAAVGLAVVVALIRGITRSETSNLGNFWVDLTRGVIRVLLPLAFLGAVVLLITRVIQNWGGTDIHTLVTGAQQTVPGGPVTSQEAITLLAST